MFGHLELQHGRFFQWDEIHIGKVSQLILHYFSLINIIISIMYVNALYVSYPRLRFGSTGWRIIKWYEKPSLCPEPIANLISKCFIIEPEKRPNFEEIKEILNLSKKNLFYVPSRKKKLLDVPGKEFTVNQSSSYDVSMKVDYFCAINRNREKQRKDSISAALSIYADLETSSSSNRDIEANTSDDVTMKAEYLETSTSSFISDVTVHI